MLKYVLLCWNMCYKLIAMAAGLLHVHVAAINSYLFYGPWNWLSFFIYASQVHSIQLFICCKSFLFLRLYLLLGNLEFPCSLWYLLSAWSSFSYLCFAWSYLCLAQRVTDMAFFAEDVHRLARYFVLTYMPFQTCFSSSCCAWGHMYLFSSPCLCRADKWVGLTLVYSY